MKYFESLIFLLTVFEFIYGERIWHSNYMDNNEKYREDFNLKNVSVDENFSMNFTVQFWKSINIRDASYAVGISQDKMVVLKVIKNETSHHLTFAKSLKEVNITYVDSTLLEMRNRKTRKNEIFSIAISNEGKLDWCTTETMELFWTWNLGYNAKQIKISFNNILKRNQLFVASEDEVNVYHFKVEERKIWLAETIPLLKPIGLFEVTSYRNQFYLLVPQNSTEQLFIFKYHDGHFVSYKNLSAAGIKQVVVFEENFKTFFAVDGLNAAIYQFGKRHNIIKERTGNLEGIEHWLPIKINNLNQNLILFGQRKLEHGSHKSLVTETFTYNNDHFEEHEDIPCQIFGEKFNSLGCFFHDENSTGLAGAASISVGDGLGLLLAKPSPQNLFIVNFESRRLENPIERDMRILNETKKKLEDLLEKKFGAVYKIGSTTLGILNVSAPVPQKSTTEKPDPVENIRTSASYREGKPTVISDDLKKEPIVGTRIDVGLSEKLDEMIRSLRNLKQKMDKVEQMEKQGKFKTLIINGESKIETAHADKVVSKTIFNEATEAAIEDIVRKDDNKPVGGTKTFSDLDVINLSFESVNGRSAQDLLFLDRGVMHITGNLTFEKPAAILGNINTETINDISSSGIVDMKKQNSGTLNFENINVEELQTGELNKLPISETWFHSKNTDGLNSFSQDDTIYIPHNLTVKRVNGDDFEDLLKELCLVNIETHIPGTVSIHGDITVEEPSHTEFLNTVKFPQNYFFVNGFSGVTVSGQKSFEGILKGNEVRTNDQYVNGVKTKDYFTLSTQQDISGKATFANLEITGKFEHEGKTIGDQINKFLPNPTLLDTTLIKSNVNFEELEVTGSVIVSGNLNDLNFEEIMGDIVYKDEVNPNINSIKEFPEGLTVRNDLTITSNSINLVPLDQIVTKDTNQVLNIAQLNGNVSIEIMEINKLINDINITKLDQEIVKTSGEQFISSVLIFKEDLQANNLEIEDKLNEIPVQNFYFTTGDRIIEHGVEFDDVEAETLVVEKNFQGSIREINLEEFDKNRMSYTKTQKIPTDFQVETSRVTNIECIDSEMENCKNIFDKRGMIDNMMTGVGSGDIKVKELIVDEDLNIERMNGILLNQIQEVKEKSITLQGDVYFASVQITKLSDANFRRFLDNVFFKNQTDIELSDAKVFTNGFDVEKLIETDKLNYVPIEYLLTKEGAQTIVAPIEIYGNVTFKSNVDIARTMNDISIEEVKNYFEMDDEIFVIKGDIMFDRLSHVYNLDVKGNLNDQDVQEILTNMAYTGAPLSFSEPMEFKGNVTIEGMLDIKGNLNGIDLSEMNENIVYLNKPDNNVIESVVTFSDPDIFAHKLVVETNLITKWMYGIDLETWQDNAVYVNKGLLQGSYHFENITIHDKLVTKHINDICMNTTIQLGSDQNIHQLSFENVVCLNNVTVGKSVNEMDLQKEYNNTVLGNREQEIESQLIFRNQTLIRNKLEIAGQLNNLPLNKIVTIDTDQNLTAMYTFPSKVVMDSNLHVTGFVNSINMSTWEYGAVKIISKESQDIQAPWHVEGNLTFEEQLEGENVVYNFDIAKESEIIQKYRQMKEGAELQYKEDSESICKDFRYLSKEAKKQIHRFESFESLQIINSLKIIGKTHTFWNNKPFLLLNGVGSCKSDLLIFEHNEFLKVSEIEMGEIDQITSTHDDNFTYFVVKVIPNSNCSIEGTNVWKYNNHTVQKLQSIDNQQQLQDSLVPSTFYGLNKQGITEFKIDIKKAVTVYPYRKWKIHEENMAFVPRGLGTGLSIRTGKKLINLIRNDPVIDNDIGFGDVFIRGETKILGNSVLPGKNNSNIAVLRVGPDSMKKTLLAVAHHEDTVVETNLDVIVIYEDYTTGKVFQKIPTYNPTSLLSLEFSNGETFLLVLENGEKLQIHEYRGTEGFKHRLTAEILGSHMFKMTLPIGPNNELLEAIAIINHDRISIIKPTMLGNTIQEKLDC